MAPSRLTITGRSNRAGRLLTGLVVILSMLLLFVVSRWRAPSGSASLAPPGTAILHVPRQWTLGVTPGPEGGDCHDMIGQACLATRLTRSNATHAISPRFGRHRADSTRSVRQIAGDGRFFRLELHSVATPGGGLVEDWMFCEVPDMINVLVEDADSKDFVLFRQAKYAIPGETLALLGGYVEPAESPLQAAKREVLEELHMECAEMVALGNGQGFRTDANRGFGVYYPFLARTCRKATKYGRSDDLEAQAVLRMPRHELEREVLAGRFRELKWTNTIAMALLHLQRRASLE